ncbi:MAG: hypothetical protein QXJ07_00850 [Candidatus Bathyarchaeia archaeon]
MPKIAKINVIKPAKPNPIPNMETDFIIASSSSPNNMFDEITPKINISIVAKNASGTPLTHIGLKLIVGLISQPAAC